LAAYRPGPVADLFVAGSQTTPELMAVEPTMARRRKIHMGSGDLKPASVIL
jgi:hypothetical protein